MKDVLNKILFTLAGALLVVPFAVAALVIVERAVSVVTAGAHGQLLLVVLALAGALASGLRGCRLSGDEPGEAGVVRRSLAHVFARHPGL